MPRLPGFMADASLKENAECAARFFGARIFKTNHNCCGTMRGTMRRIFASFLIALIAWGSFAPMAMASVSDPVPACCRRDGKHHCNMGTSRLDSSQDGQLRLRVQAPDCPFRGQHGVALIAAVLPSDSAFATQLFVSSRLPFPGSVSLSSPVFGSISERGPPALL